MKTSADPVAFAAAVMGAATNDQWMEFLSMLPKNVGAAPDLWRGRRRARPGGLIMRSEPTVPRGRWSTLYGVNLFIMESRVGVDDARRRFLANKPPRFHRPSQDSTPTETAYLTDSEIATLRRRISSYLSECGERRRRETS